MDIVGRGTDALDIFSARPIVEARNFVLQIFLAAEKVRPAKLHELLPARTIFLQSALISKKSQREFRPHPLGIFQAPARLFPAAYPGFVSSTRKIM